MSKENIHNKGKQTEDAQGEIRKVSPAWTCNDETRSSYKQ